MKAFFGKRKNLNIIFGVGSLLLFLVMVLCFYRYFSQMKETLGGNGPLTATLREQAFIFLTSFLVIYVIFLLGLSLIEVLLNYQNEQLQETFLMLRERYDIIFHSYASTAWEFDVASDTLSKSNCENGIFSDSTEIHDFRKYMLSSSNLHTDDHQAFLQFYDDMLSYEEVPLQVELRIRNASNEYIWFRMVGNKIRNKNGTPISVVGHTVDISLEKQEEKNRQEMAHQDRLTRLHRYDGCAELIDQYFKQLDYATISAMFLINFDDFSKVSEKYGRVFSDAVLLDFSARLRKKFSPQDVLGRLGTDTFLVFITDVPSMADIESCADGLCTMLHEVYSGEGSSIVIRASVGVSVFPTNGNQFDILYRRAAQALHRAKQLGKDRYYIFDRCLEEVASETPNYCDLSEASCDYLSYDESSLINTGMVTNAIDILFDAHESDLSIQMLLSLIGAYYNLDRLSVYQNDPAEKTVSITHEWVSNPKYQLKHQLQDLSYEEGDRYAYYKQTESGVFYADRLLPEEDTPLGNLVFTDHEPQSLFQCGISERGEDFGSVTATIFDSSHCWTKNEVDSLTLICKLIGSYIARFRTLQHADWITRTDQLTNSYNFNSFLSEITKYHAAHPEQPLAMLYSDLHQFKLLNENYGYQTGDFVLQSLADIFREVCPDGILCRISGDKFALCIPDSGGEELSRIAKLLISRCKQLHGEEGEDFKLSLVIGIYQMKHNDSGIIALDRANIARKNAQHKSFSGYAFFNDNMQASLLLRKNLEDSMEDSLLQNAFLVYFQPKFDIATRTICGAEALVRWQHPTLGFLSPNTFIPLFESNGFIVDLDYYMFEQVCIYMRDLLRRGETPFPISVNLSGEHFKTNGLPEKLKAAVEFYHVPPHLIEIEMTESTFVGIDQHLMDLLEQLRSYGFRLAMDDFGSGVSSLNLLSSLPFNVLKIDKDFFHSKTTTERERIVISNIVRMASELEIDVICEGVETEEQAQFLLGIGCNRAQGYLYSKPVSKAAFDTKYFS